MNVAVQRRDPQSMLNWTERMLRMRKEVPEIGWGSFAVVRVGTPEVLAIRYDWRNNAALFVHNLAPLSREVSLSLGHQDSRDRLLINLLSEDHSRADDAGRDVRCAREGRSKACEGGILARATFTDGLLGNFANPL